MLFDVIFDSLKLFAEVFSECRVELFALVTGM